jgi:hypothetical protein
MARDWSSDVCSSDLNALSMEVVRFDMQAMENPEITNTEYQQGTLFGYEARAYLLQKWHHTCAYCVTPVTGHHLSGEQSLTFYGNESMLNVSLAPERLARTIV